MQKFYNFHESPIGRLLLIGTHQALQHLYFPNNWTERDIEGCILSPATFNQVTEQLNEYFRQERQDFDLPIDPKGTTFQQQVWHQLTQIPYGATASYQDVATHIGKPKACRAVGMANRCNPIPIIIPCHRVIGKNGTLTGFGGGLDVKQLLLDLEKSNIPQHTSFVSHV
ncbi:methylated-DNA--[protein]-cysteine S-methyltransferase [Desulforhopalus sp. IMCC35007]|uniref:methylated-DNA--[protein]-cysteine S-methyltransferase n=1 Tax=Desulforhopalus sp. IMCC35007 TaxID=2569543 RepID=UPI0010AE845B|nr:methylated-DNA--[protein]-cysteine S-methyltransferase [Desulforhopalus sp. IMCC35007]TKB05739.1 methylated-DNA--[protein]-cysteine S-methyltransferase [Desulforhopalus sp. IMCC35007]